MQNLQATKKLNVNITTLLDIGKYNDLLVKSKSAAGYYLHDGDESVLLPERSVSGDLRTGQVIKVFVYLDHENRPIATTAKPFAMVGEFAYLTAKDVTKHGAFLDWGIPKDLFVPHQEQRVPVKPGMSYIVYVYLDDKSGRITASTKWTNFLEKGSGELEEGDEVQLLITEETSLGFKTIVDNKYEGLLYRNEIFQPLKTGDRRKGFVKFIREDGKIDLSLQQQGFKNVLGTKEIILQKLKEHQGILELGDKSSPEEIAQVLQISKKVFKKTIGTLYKEGLIVPGDFETRLVDPRGD